MRSIPTRFPVLATLLLLAGCGGGAPVTASSAGASSESGGMGVTGGGYRIESGGPTLFYGTLLEQGRRTFTYLVIARAIEPDGWSLEQSWLGTSTASGDALASQHSLTVDGRELQASFRARVADGRAVERELGVNGASFPADQWLLLHDAGGPDQTPRPHAAPMPELPADLEALEPAVQAYVERLASEDPLVAAFLQG